MSPEQFDAFAREGYNRIPLSREILADFDTPLSTWSKLVDGPYSYLFESVHGGEKWGRYSVIGLPCRTVVRVHEHEVTVTTDDEVVERETVDDPLAWVERFHGRYRVPDIEGLPRVQGGLVGYFGYETVRYIEPRLDRPDSRPDPLGTPTILLMVSDEVVVFDNLRGTAQLIVFVEASEEGRAAGEARLDDLIGRLRGASAGYPPPVRAADVTEKDFVSGFTEAGYKDAVERIKRYIVDGDVMQVVPSQRMTVPFAARPIDLYRALRCLNPSPYMYLLDFDEFQVVGASPEILTRVEDGEVTVRPIAGTRPRGADEAGDRALEQELLADPKELAEHLMLIDLGRNDVGRVAEIGSVEVTDRMTVERYSHVMHIVSNVIGRLRPGLSAIDVLRATFPAGTLSGAPKIRALEIIDELEPVRRGVYSGAVGYLAWSGDMDTAIAIRTAVIKGGELHVQAGGGIVHDSVPQNEWDETMNKARAMIRAVELAERGLDTADGIPER
ncbi:MAG: anthranilate synthase component I [Halofilum sp. (in: g-proteobacteria)]|nr:anthranilate synthase component I [Halofilum sp. (in: g-proteobacteria)]